MILAEPPTLNADAEAIDSESPSPEPSYGSMKPNALLKIAVCRLESNETNRGDCAADSALRIASFALLKPIAFAIHSMIDSRNSTSSSMLSCRCMLARGLECTLNGFVFF